MSASRPTAGVIDVHTHILPRGWDDFLARHTDTRWPRIVREQGGGCALYRGTVRDRGLTAQIFDPAVRVADLDRLGIARQLLSPPPLMFCYWAEPGAAAEFCRFHNDAIAAVVAAEPARFLGAAIIPLQAPALAVKELERATRLGLRCVEIGSSVDGRDLDDETLHPVWEAAAALDVALFVHPAAPVLGAERVRAYNLPLVLGNPLETALTITWVIYGGLLDRWPRLRWCFAHAGGAFAFVLGRVEHGWHVMPEGKAAVATPPSAYARRFWVDSITHSPPPCASSSTPMVPTAWYSAATIRSGWVTPIRWPPSTRRRSMHRPERASSRRTPKNSWDGEPTEHHAARRLDDSTP